MAADGVERRAPEGRQRPFYHLRTSIKGKRMPRFYSVRSLWFEHTRESSWDRRVIPKITACRFIARDLWASFNNIASVWNGDLVYGGMSCFPEPIKDGSLGGNTIYFVSYIHPLCLTLRPFPAFRVVFNRRFWMDRFLIYVDSEWGIDIYSHTCVTPSIGSRPSMVLANVWILCIHVPNSKILWAPMLPKAQQILSGDGDFWGLWWSSDITQCTRKYIWTPWNPRRSLHRVHIQPLANITTVLKR